MSCKSSRPTAVITGASSGIGAAVAINLIKDGWNVCMIARSYDKMKNITEKYKNLNNHVKIIQCDALKPSQIISSCKQIKLWSDNNVNLLFNNIGGPSNNSLGGCLEECTLNDWNNILNLNLRTSFLFTQQLLSSLKNAATIPCKYNNNIYDACIINNSSVAAKDISFYSVSIPYSISKSAINQLNKLNALELSKYKIRVNCIAPGNIKTPIWGNLGYKSKN